MSNPDRSMARTAFLQAQGWGAANRAHLAGDASARSYERVALPHKEAILMDAPPGCGDDVSDFVKIAMHLQSLGLSAPQIYAQDLDQGFLLIEDLGDNLYTVLAQSPEVERQIYRAAVEVLAHLHHAPLPQAVPDLCRQDWVQSTRLAVEDYAGGICGEVPDGSVFFTALDAALSRIENANKVLILRDFHAGNLLWLPDRVGQAQVGLLDFQLAQLGQPGYDLVSLLQDARRDVAADTQQNCLEYFVQLTGLDLAQFRASYAVLGALRALRILGIFARLCVTGGKSQYLQYLPRVWGQVQQNLSHPELAELRAAALAILPAPTLENIQILEAKCARSASH